MGEGLQIIIIINKIRITITIIVIDGVDKIKWRIGMREIKINKINKNNKKNMKFMEKMMIMILKMLMILIRWLIWMICEMSYIQVKKIIIMKII
jgi:hypothetical protein